MPLASVLPPYSRLVFGRQRFAVDLARAAQEPQGRICLRPIRSREYRRTGWRTGAGDPGSLGSSARAQSATNVEPAPSIAGDRRPEGSRHSARPARARVPRGVRNRAPNHLPLRRCRSEAPHLFRLEPSARPAADGALPRADPLGGGRRARLRGRLRQPGPARHRRRRRSTRWRWCRGRPCGARHATPRLPAAARQHRPSRWCGCPGNGRCCSLSCCPAELPESRAAWSSSSTR